MEFFRQIEEKWQKKWENAKIFEADPDSTRPKYYITVAYPYPNSPQHIGHGRTYTLADVHARYKRMRGFNVLLPMAFHYTGTPVLAMAKRLEDNDTGLVSDFVNVYKIPREKLKDLADPMAMASYFHQEIIDHAGFFVQMAMASMPTWMEGVLNKRYPRWRQCVYGQTDQPFGDGAAT